MPRFETLVFVFLYLNLKMEDAPISILNTLANYKNVEALE